MNQNDRRALITSSLWRAATGARPAPTGWFHFSVDDVFRSLIRVSDQRLSLFAEPMFAFLRDLHAQFELAVDLYVFQRGRVDGVMRSLQDVSARNRSEFEQADWLSLGPHGLDYENPPYAQGLAEQRASLREAFNEIERFAGRASLGSWLRLHCFSECYELAPLFRRWGCSVLFLTDKDSVSYRLPEAERDLLRRRGFASSAGMVLVRSNLRIAHRPESRRASRESVGEIDRWLAHQGFVVLFTHEIDLGHADVRREIVACLRHLTAAGVAPL